jgi:hypothetical protein
VRNFFLHQIDLPHLSVLDNQEYKNSCRIKRKRMNRKKLYAAFAISITAATLWGDCNDSSRLEATGKTTLAIHPLFVSQQPEMVSGFRSERSHAREEGRGGMFQAVFFGSRTTEGKDLARYFFFNGQDTLSAAEVGPVAGAAGFGTQNLLAQDFNVFTINGNFQSKITISPEQSVIGLGLHDRQSFWHNYDRGSGFWLSASTSIQHVKNMMNFQEFVINDGGGVNEAASDDAVANMTQAFSQSDWNYGKICAGSSMKKTGLADIEFKLGYEWLQLKPAHMESYIGVVIPTGNRNEAEYVFEPIVGRGKYAGLMFGSCLGLAIWDHETGDASIRYELAYHTEILFKRDQKRSFDLKNRPWSRYLPVYTSQDQAMEAAGLAAPLNQNFATPGINVFTQELKVTPGLTQDINTAFVFNYKRFQGEVGYNFLAKRAENVEFDCPWPTTIALKHFLGAGQTNPIRTISGSPYYEQLVSSIPVAPSASVPLIPVSVANYSMSIIQVSDIDLNSAATPAILSNTLYLTLGFDLEDREFPLFGNVGGSFTFSKNNDAVPRRWVLWAKMGLSF